MISLDTNVLVRVLTNDDPAQARRATNVLRANKIWVSKTVILETEWVLRYSYNLSAAKIQKAFTMLAQTKRIELEDRGAVLRAIQWWSFGMDFADALHLASSHGVNRFVTFDKALVAKGKKLQVSPNVELG